MSKHQKEVRRERKKTDRARRRGSLIRNPQSAIRNGAAALAAAAVIAAGTQAYADPVRFDNPAHADPGHFHWAVPPGGITGWLDVMLPASGQPGASDVPSAFRHVILASGASRIETLPTVPNGLQVEPYYSWHAMGVGAGELIPSGLPWSFYGYIYYPGYGSYLPEGEPTYLGIKFDVGSGYQYGWIGVERDYLALEAFAWGYETEVGVPIPAGVPEPGSLALLAFGAAAVLRRRHA